MYVCLPDMLQYQNLLPLQATVITRDEWLRLQLAARGGNGSPHPAVSDRKERHERSKAIVKHWENTIEVSP